MEGILYDTAFLTCMWLTMELEEGVVSFGEGMQENSKQSGV